MIIGIEASSLEGQRTGVGRYLLNLLNQWNQRENTQVKFILYFKDEIPVDLNLKSSLFKKRIVKSRFSSNALFLHYFLPKAVKEDRVDLLFCPAYIAPLFYKEPIALTLHDIIYEARPRLYNWPSFLDRFLLRKVSAWSAKKAKVILTPSEFSRQEVLKYYQVEPEKVMTTHLATDDSFELIADKESIETAKKKLGVKNKYLLYIGSIFNRRHLPEIICSFKEVANDFPDYQLLIIGKNHTSPWINLEHLIETMNREIGRDLIVWKKYLDSQDLSYIYNGADLLVWLSDYEGFGLPVLEAMACGTPVLTTKSTSLAEIAADSALFIKDNKDIKAIQEEMHKGLTDKKIRQELIEKGFKRVEDFSWSKCAEKTLEALQR